MKFKKGDLVLLLNTGYQGCIDDILGQGADIEYKVMFPNGWMYLTQFEMIKDIQGERDNKIKCIIDGL